MDSSGGGDIGGPFNNSNQSGKNPIDVNPGAGGIGGGGGGGFFTIGEAFFGGGIFCTNCDAINGGSFAAGGVGDAFFGNGTIDGGVEGAFFAGGGRKGGGI